MKKIFTLLFLLLVVAQVCSAQSVYFQLEGKKLDSGQSVTIKAQPDSFFPDEKNCMTNPPSNPKGGLVLVMPVGGSGSATLEILSNTLNPTLVQWCMGGACEPMNDKTRLSKTFTAGSDGIVQVDFDANNVKADGLLEAKLTATVSGETVVVNIRFTNPDTSGMKELKCAEQNSKRCYDLNGHSLQSAHRGIYIQEGKKYVNK